MAKNKKNQPKADRKIVNRVVEKILLEMKEPIENIQSSRNATMSVRALLAGDEHKELIIKSSDEDMELIRLYGDAVLKQLRIKLEEFNKLKDEILAFPHPNKGLVITPYIKRRREKMLKEIEEALANGIARNSKGYNQIVMKYSECFIKDIWERKMNEFEYRVFQIASESVVTTHGLIDLNQRIIEDLEEEKPIELTEDYKEVLKTYIEDHDEESVDSEEGLDVTEVIKEEEMTNE